LETWLMSRTHWLCLSGEQEAELTRLRDHHPKPYVRERTAALLKVAAGQTIKHVAEQGLLRPRQEETVGDWIARYREQGVAGLGVRPGRGRKPAFSPSTPHGPRRGDRTAGAHPSLASAL
jgi:hypothetical protein